MSDFVLEPTDDHVVVVPEEPVKETASGLVLPEGARQDGPDRGLVRAIGPGRIEKGKRIPVGVDVGDRVLFNRFLGREVRVDGLDYIILKAGELLAREA